jgi:biopolymer transport protein ExbD
MAISRKRTEDEQPGRYVSARKRRGAAKPKIQPPLVPMIDVTFLLLLYFVLTAEFRKAEGHIPGTVPEQGEIGAEAVVPIKPIHIAIRRGWDEDAGVYYQLGGIQVSGARELYERLEQRRNLPGAEEVPVVIQPMADVPWQYVIEAFNQAVRAKFLKIGFAPSG